DGVRAGSAAFMAGMGRRGSAAGETRALLAGFLFAAAEARISGGALRALRDGMRPLPDYVRYVYESGRAGLSEIRGRGRGPGGALRGVAIRRARRRAIACGTAAENVWQGIGAGVSRIQGDLGPGLEDESRQGGGPAPAGRGFAAGAIVQALGAEDALSVSERSRTLFGGGAAVRGRGEMPARKLERDRRPDHLPELHGHARGKAFDARTRALAMGNAARRSDSPSVARRERERGARPVPFLQGLQRRLPRECGHGDVQGGVSFALLGGTHSSALSLRLRMD